MKIVKGTFDHIPWAKVEGLKLSYCHVENLYEITLEDGTRIYDKLEDETEVEEIIKDLDLGINDATIEEMFNHVFG